MLKYKLKILKTTKNKKKQSNNICRKQNYKSFMQILKEPTDKKRIVIVF